MPGFYIQIAITEISNPDTQVKDHEIYTTDQWTIYKHQRTNLMAAQFNKVTFNLTFISMCSTYIKLNPIILY